MATNDELPLSSDQEATVTTPSNPDNDPMKIAAKRFWEQLWRTRVGRLFGLGYILLAVLGWCVAQFEVIGKIRTFLTRPSTSATLDEITCLNEWVLKVASENSRDAAEHTQERFLQFYRNMGHTNYRGEPIWENDVHVVRDPLQPNEWLVVIDMYPGASSRECMEFGKAEMIAVLDAKPTEERRHFDTQIGRMIRPAEPLCYDLSEFEHTNGKILNGSSDVQYQRSLGSCAKKLSIPPGQVCTSGN